MFQKYFIIIFIFLIYSCTSNNNPRVSSCLSKRINIHDSLKLVKSDFTNHKTVLDTCIGKLRLIVSQYTKSKEFAYDYFLAIDTILNDTIYFIKDCSFDSTILKIDNNLYAIEYDNGGTCAECDAYHLFFIDNTKFKFCGNFHEAKDLNFDGRKEFILYYDVWTEHLCHAETPKFMNIYSLDKNLQLHTNTTLEKQKYQPIYDKLLSTFDQNTHKKFTKTDYSNIILISYYCRNIKKVEQLNNLKKLILKSQCIFTDNKDKEWQVSSACVAKEMDSLVIDSSDVMYFRDVY